MGDTMEEKQPFRFDLQQFAGGMTWSSAAGLDPTFDEMTAGSVGPAGGPSVAQLATGSGRRMVGNMGTSGSDTVGTGGGTGANTGPAPNFFIGLIVFVVFCLVIMWVAHRFGPDDGEFKSIRASAYNVLFVAFVAAAGLPVIKIAIASAASAGVPLMSNASAWVQAA